MTTIHTILDEFRQVATSKRDLGDRFERLMAKYLMTDPEYSNKLTNVWLWSEWPYRWGGVDVGIDLVAKEADTGGYWAIQCKFFASDHTVQKSDIDSFFTASGKRFTDDAGEHSFAARLVVSTTDNWSKHANDALADQTIPTTRLRVQNLAESPIDWSQFSLSNIDDIRLRKKKQLRDHQVEALEAVVEGFNEHERGKLIMACGTGKTFTSLRIAETTTREDGLVLFLAPSISLISQTLREWTAEAASPIHALVVCSDTKVGKENEDIQSHDLAYPPTTNADRLAFAYKKLTRKRRTVVFSTYQSIQVVADAQGKGLGDFDLIICDEAHRTTGITLESEVQEDKISDFVKVHDQGTVRGKKRLYMTATPRIYTGASKTKAEQKSAVLYSMDDKDKYGPEFYRLGFGKAVEQDLLADYKVLIIAVDEDRMAQLANEYNAFKIDSKKAINSDLAKKIIGSWKGLSKQGLFLVGDEGREAISDDAEPMHRAVAFARSIKDSEAITQVFSEVVSIYSQDHQDGQGHMVHCVLDHVDGRMNALRRQSALEWLTDDPDEGNCRILSNARCLSEGIDVPALDAVIFFDTRESIVDIVQSVGRVMRKFKDKDFGYIILPVGIPFSSVEDYNTYIENDPQFKSIWRVIKALRAHDESLVDEAEFRRKIKIVPDIGKKGGDRDGGETAPLDLEFPQLPIDEISNAVYAAIPKKLGDLEYWSEWAKSVADIVDRIKFRIHALLARPEARVVFQSFLKGLHDNLNPSIDEEEAIDMLCQHIVTRPVFDVIFEGYSFTQNNPVSKSMQAVIDIMDDHVISSETDGLDKLYNNVRERVRLAKSDKSRQDIIRNLYDTFFTAAFPKMSKRLGIVYTPVQVVDFIIQSVEIALRKHFSTGLTEKGVQILDPFTGTGTFIVRLLQSGLIRKEDLVYKFDHELHANEIVLLAYYIASINIESTYHALVGEYHPYDGIVLTDTFEMAEEHDWVDEQVLPENSERVKHQKKQDIRVIIGNPPYSAEQDNENDNNRNLSYPTLDAGIRSTYAAQSTATLKNKLYDSYIRAIRWASDRVKEQGIVAFISNGSYIEKNTLDGLRKCLVNDFSYMYVFNLRGFIRGKSGDDAKREGENIFNIMTGVAISVMIKDPNHQGECELYYYDIGDHKNREEKLSIIENFHDIDGVPWDRITPNESGDWINQEAYTRHGNCVTSKFPELYDAAQSIRSHTAILDCEGICLRDGRSVFDDFAYRGRLTNPKAIQRAVETHPASFVVFDVLYTNRDHTKEPLTTRKTWLDGIILPSAAIAPTLYVDGAGLALQKMTQDRGLEGIVSKSKDSRYSLNVRSTSWIKIKNFKTMDVVILGYRREPRFALVVGVFDSGEGHHRPVAVVEFGFKPEEKVAFLKVVKEIHTVKDRHTQWIEPRLCARVQFLERTERRYLRIVSFKGFLPRKMPEDCLWIS